MRLVSQMHTSTVFVYASINSTQNSTPQHSFTHFGIFVDLGLVLDVLGSVGVPQCTDGLVEVVVRGTAVRAHYL